MNLLLAHNITPIITSLEVQTIDWFLRSYITESVLQQLDIFHFLSHNVKRSNGDFLSLTEEDFRCLTRPGVILQIWNREKFWPFAVILKRSESLLEYSFYISYEKPLLPELGKGRSATVLGDNFSHVFLQDDPCRLT